MYIAYSFEGYKFMAATKRIKGRSRGKSAGTAHNIEKMKEKYGDAVALIQDVDRGDRSKLYKIDHNRMVFWLSLAGLNEYQMASVIGISDATLGVWKKTRPDFMAAMSAGRQEAVATSAHSLFKVGNGFESVEERLIPNRVKEYNPDTGRVVKEYTDVMRVQVTKYHPPNVQALLKFLAAKFPEVWGDRTEVHHTNRTEHAIDATKLSKKKLKMLQAIAKSGAKVDQVQAKADAKVESDHINNSRKKKKKKKKKPATK